MKVSADNGVFVLHSIPRTSALMRVMQHAPKAACYAAPNLNDRSRRQPLNALADAKHSPVARFAAMVPGSAIHVVAHSMGSLLTHV